MMRVRKLGVVAVAVGCNVLLLAGPAAAQQSANRPLLEGAVTINGSQAQQGLRLVGRSPDDLNPCAVAVVGTQGSYVMAPMAPCEPGTDMVVVLAAAPDQSPQTVEVTEGQQRQDLAFDGVSEQALAQVTADAAAVGTVGDGSSGSGAAEAAASQGVVRPPSLLSPVSLNWLLAIIVGLAISLLAVMAIARVSHSRRRLALLRDLKDWDNDKLATFAEAFGSEGELVEDKLFSRQLIEGMVLSIVVIAILVLGAAGRITQEGLVSVLAAIVGYAAGRGGAS